MHTRALIPFPLFFILFLATVSSLYVLMYSTQKKGLAVQYSREKGLDRWQMGRLLSQSFWWSCSMPQERYRTFYSFLFWRWHIFSLCLKCWQLVGRKKKKELSPTRAKLQVATSSAQRHDAKSIRRAWHMQIDNLFFIMRHWREHRMRGGRIAQRQGWPTQHILILNLRVPCLKRLCSLSI